MLRTRTVPILVLLLGVAAIAAITLLQEHAADGREAQVKLANLKTELVALQDAPFQADARNGGSPAFAARALRTGKQHVAGTLAELRRTAPAPSLADVDGPLRADYASLDKIYALGVSGQGYDERADHLAMASGHSVGAAMAALGRASREYDRRASASDSRATAGSAVAILALVLAFAFLYRRAVRSREVAERLARENEALLAASREEALTDQLTGLRNRRALVDDLAADLERAGGERKLLLALFDLDGFKHFNDTFGHPSGDAVLARLSQRLRKALDGVATPYRMGGDEFCLLAWTQPGQEEAVVALAADALREGGVGYAIDSSHGWALVPDEAKTASGALRLADQRMYAHKASETRPDLAA